MQVGKGPVQAAAVGGGGGCGCLVLVLFAGGVLYEVYQWFLSILPTLMLIGGWVLGIAIFIGLVKAMGIGKTLMLSIVVGGSFGVYSYVTGIQEERQREETAKQDAVVRAQQEKVAAKIQVVETARRAKITEALAAYFSPPGKTIETPAILVNVHKSYAPGSPRKRSHSASITISSARIDGLMDEPISGVKFYQGDGVFTFVGHMTKYSNQYTCSGSVEYNKRGRELIIAAYCLKDDTETVETTIRYVPIKTKKARKALEALFATETPAPESAGVWLASSETCPKRIRTKEYTYVGRSLLVSDAPSLDLELFMVQASSAGAATKFVGMSQRHRKRVSCTGSIEPVGKMKQARFQCSSSFVDAENPGPDGRFNVAQKTHREQVFYLCKSLKRFP